MVDRIQKMQRILDHVDSCYQDINDLAEMFAREQMRELSKRWPKRKIQFVSAMGSACVYIPFAGGVKQVTGSYSQIHGLPPFEWMDQLDRIGENIGNGCASLPFHFEVNFLNGKQVNRDGK